MDTINGIDVVLGIAALASFAAYLSERAHARLAWSQGYVAGNNHGIQQMMGGDALMRVIPGKDAVTDRPYDHERDGL